MILSKTSVIFENNPPPHTHTRTQLISHSGTQGSLLEVTLRWGSGGTFTHSCYSQFPFDNEKPSHALSRQPATRMRIAEWKYFCPFCVFVPMSCC